MVESLNYSLEKDKMVKNFKFFHGIIRGGTLTVTLGPQEHVDMYAIDAEAELTRLMSERISEEIDNEIISELIIRINGDTGVVERVYDLGPIFEIVFNSDIFKSENFDYSHCLNGIAYKSGNDFVHVTGKNWPYVFKIKFN